MFSSLRYITIVVFGFLVVLTLLAGVYLKHSFIENTIKTASEDESTFIANTFTRSIWNRFYPAMASLYDFPREEWDVYPHFILFQNETNKLFEGSLDILKIRLISPTGVEIYDSSPQLNYHAKPHFLSFFEGDLTLEQMQNNALLGKREMTIINYAQVKDGTSEFKRSILISYIPIKVTEVFPGTAELASKALAILEITYDINSSVNKLETLQFSIVFIVICALSILTGAIFLYSQKAEIVLDRQQEASLEMAAAKASAEAESRSKSQFLANVSHELRTPLNAIIGFSEIISSESMGPIGNEQYKEFVRDIHTSGVHLLSLINDILDFSKAEENKLSVDIEQVDLSKLAKICIRMVSPRAEEAKVSIIDETPPEHIKLLADNKRLKQAILNVLSNSVKFTPEGGVVTIRTTKDIESNLAVIEIIDTGVGMAPQDLARALSPFGQVDNKLSRRYEGTGLGLPLTKKLVELMKGRFDIKSESGVGTTVIMSFPLVEESL